MIEITKLHAFVDGELSDAERHEVELCLAGCKESQAEVASIRGIKSALNGTSHFECNDVWANCQSRLDAMDRVAKSGNFITKYSWAFVTAVAMIVLIGGGFSRHNQAGAVASSSLAGVFSSSRQVSPEKAFRNEQLDQLLRNADQNLSKFKIISISEGLLANGIVAQRYELEDVHGRMTLIALPRVTSFEDMSPNATGTYFYGQIGTSENAVGWKTKNASLILVGIRDFAALEEIARTRFILPE